MALALLGLLFGSDLLLGVPGTPRWHDRTWLAWLAMFAYLLHNVEEYGIDMFGRRRGFVTGMNAVFKLPPEPQSPIPARFFTAVNVPLFWIGAPVAALLSEHHPLVGFVIYSVIFINALVHIVPLLLGAGYSSGTLTAILVFLPLSGWVGYTCFGAGGLTYKAMALLIGFGVVLHVILMGSVQLFVRKKIGARALIAIQFFNTFLLFVLAWSAEKWAKGILG
ncbi:MAG TPA: HXXEE domain-containing protein [Chthoniobacteraceae bacterium]|nr:HXXEE domain-containing protein [Chthoniobacteraceae bacterium]